MDEETGYDPTWERRWMLILLQREREESEILVAQGLNYAKIGPFLSTDRSFFENLRSGVANTCSHHSCKLQSEEHFIVWLHWFVPSARSKKGLKHGHVSHSHISRVRQQLHRVTYIWYNNNNRVHARVTQHECSSLNWIDNTSAGGVDNFTPSVSMVFSSEWTEGGGRCLWIWSQASSSNPGPDTCTCYMVSLWQTSGTQVQNQRLSNFWSVWSVLSLEVTEGRRWF